MRKSAVSAGVRQSMPAQALKESTKPASSRYSGCQIKSSRNASASRVNASVGRPVDCPAPSAAYMRMERTTEGAMPTNTP